jgi:hypothetical protein
LGWQRKTRENRPFSGTSVTGDLQDTPPRRDKSRYLARVNALFVYAFGMIPARLSATLPALLRVRQSLSGTFSSPENVVDRMLSQADVKKAVTVF